MTSYHGGKQRIGLEIAQTIHLISIILENQGNFKIKGYCEPFCGMLGVYRHIPELFEEHVPKLKYKAGDVNKSVIKMWQAVQKGWKPPVTCSKTKFEKMKDQNEPTAEKGFLGHVYTYRGVFLDGYFNHNPKKIRGNCQRVLDIAQDTKKVNFSSGTYNKYSGLQGYIIYCDPPYAETSCRYYDGRGYFDQLTFDNDKFWKWCRDMSKNNIVFVSEYSAPKDFMKVWEKGNEKLYLI